ncbi:MAG: type II secretion system protein [Kiritimatiellae bacterium]|jgi:prepilin-type N-terminal cleavage/methylation domain-containing protein|nr:type II secretion system protein [Kiritimatiellia bacterium]
MKKTGFTLIEVLVVIAGISILSTLIVTAAGSAMNKALRTREVSAARTLAQGYLLYATDHGGRLMPSYANDPAWDEEGNVIPHPVNARYPWRLAPYLNYNVRGVYLLHKGQARSSEEDNDTYYYRTSVHPALGINMLFFGGDESGTSGQGLRPIPAHEAVYGQFCVTRLSQAVSPSTLIVFASARHNGSDGHAPGFHRVESPRFTGSRWADEWDPAAEPAAFGFVDLRYDERAVVSRLDGSAGLVGEGVLRDMRNWSNQAARANDPDWLLHPL